jgi:hypothetical protein
MGLEDWIKQEDEVELFCCLCCHFNRAPSKSESHVNGLNASTNRVVVNTVPRNE